MNTKELVNLLNEQISEKEAKFKLDEIHETLAKDDGKRTSSFIGFANSIEKDTNIIPSELKTIKYTKHQKEISTIRRWINQKLFQSCINWLLHNHNILMSTLDVRIRIAINMIMKTSLNRNDKLLWISHLHRIIRIREKVMFEWYLINIAQIPF